MTIEPLFRDQALEYQNLSSSRYGRVMPGIPVTWWGLAGLTGAFLVCLLIFISTVDFARTEIVRKRCFGPTFHSL